MRFYHIMLAIIFISAGTSCKQKLELPSVSSFQVTTDSASYNVGSPTTFNFKGDPYTLTFYSGEIGHRYIYRNRVTAAGTSLLNFTTALNSGTQANSLQILVSINFAGIVAGDTVTTQANIGKATWTDETANANLAVNSTATASSVNLTGLAVSGTPVYIAFKYSAQSGTIQNKWTIANLTLTNLLADGSSYTIANLATNTTPITTNYAGVNTFSPGWVAYPVANTYNWTVTAGTSLVVAGAGTVAASTAYSEAWAIMGPIDLTKVTPDVGVAVKSIVSQVPSYQYTYSTAGTYSATFSAVNEDVHAVDSVSRTIPVVVH